MANTVHEMLKQTGRRRAEAVEIDAMLPLARGCIVFGYAVSTLRAEARKGNLELTKIEGQSFVTESAIRQMERKFWAKQAS